VSTVRSAPLLLQHNRVTLALHELDPGRDGDARPLLMLHGLGERTPVSPPEHLDWPGRVLGLDFTGHGDSTVPTGGGYTTEVLLGDVDAALTHLDEPVTILGRGLGAYVGLLCAAARPDVVHGVVMTDGPGLAGGGVHPGSRALVNPVDLSSPPDPYAMMELARDIRPADYARTFAGLVADGSQLDVPLWVAAVVRPAWIQAILDLPGVGRGSVQRGLDTYLHGG
jgi:pimeloyl-ACP methyl ester carboxylesterase